VGLRCIGHFALVHCSQCTDFDDNRTKRRDAVSCCVRKQCVVIRTGYSRWGIRLRHFHGWSYHVGIRLHQWQWHRSTVDENTACWLTLVGDTNGFQPSKSSVIPYLVTVVPGGAFSSATNYATGTGQSPHFITTADFNGDGKLDLATANYGSFDLGSDNVSILLGNGDGTFQAAANYAAGSGPYFITVGDLKRRLQVRPNCCQLSQRH